MRMKHHIIVFLIVFLSSCGSMDTRKKLETLDESIKQYNIAMRWALYNKAQGYHMLKDGARLKIDPDSLKHIRITGYSVTEKILNDDLTESVVHGEFNYYHNEYGTLKKASFTHNWWYDPDSKSWFNESEFPDFE